MYKYKHICVYMYVHTPFVPESNSETVLEIASQSKNGGPKSRA